MALVLFSDQARSGAPKVVMLQDEEWVGAVRAEAGIGDALARAIVDAAPDGIVVVDAEGAIVVANRTLEEMFGFDRGELVGRPVDELLPPRFRDGHRDLRHRYGIEPRVRPMGIGQTLYGYRRDDTEFPVEISLSPMRTGDRLRVVAIVRDVSERISAEAETRRIKKTLDASRDAVLIFDADTLRFLYANQGAVDQVGYGVEDLLTMEMPDIAPEYTEQRLRELLAPVECGDVSSVMFTTRHRHRDGAEIPVEVILQATDFEDERPHAYVEVARDISVRIESEARLREADEVLRIVEERDRIARDLHDLVIQRLFAVGLTVQGVQARSSDQDLSRRLAPVVDELDETIRDIRSVIFALQTGPADSAAGLRAGIIRVIADESAVLGFEPRLHFEGVLEGAPAEIEEQLFLTLREALSNVGRHAHASSALVTVTGTGAAVALRVEDDGIGIADEGERHGHGLANIRSRAAQLGGTCTIAEGSAGGTTVEWTVPLPSR